ncbi:hypothetical protein BJ944DRAFT_234026 [Cunninghamella echinulata]|nr:hypothetical protein BJ944DRAFT_234026 [Cunninghamella echinulata]
MPTEDPPLPPFNSTGEEPMSYALFPENKGYFYTHVAFMILAFWILMPIGIMFGIAKSSFHVPTQILAFLVALLGYFFGHLYAHSTPHLYKGNSHHKLGWIIFLFMIAQLAVGVVRKIANAVGKSQKSVHYQVLDHSGDDDNDEETVRLVRRSSSILSQHGGDNHSEGSIETLHHNGGYDQHPKKENDDEHDDIIIQQQHSEQDEEEEGELLLDDEDPVNLYEEEKPSLWMRGINVMLPYIPKMIKKAFVYTAYNPFTKTVCRYYHSIMGRVFVVLIFTQTLSGLVVYHGVCREWQVLGCIAHLIKGGIFFFYGMLTFGRYLGAFAEKGWAWNYVQGGGAKFSFEFIECGLIFTYGITNTWMEHFGQDSAWTHKDFEHASLAFMWWWCGLIGLLVESRSVRRLLEKSILTLNTDKEAEKKMTKPTHSFNPFPALTVMITGISMGNHHQETQYGTQVHYLWGLLLALAALCRILTYVFLFRNTPTSIQPSRPPTELLGAFCLIAGSILFMASNAGTMTWMRRLNVDTMFMLNVCVALTSITLCYVAGLMILKGWAWNREQRKKEARRQNNGPFNNTMRRTDRFIGQDA